MAKVGPKNLVNPRFRELLPHAPELEKMSYTGLHQDKRKPDYTKIKTDALSKLLVDNGIVGKSIDKFNALKRVDNDASIPNVLIDGQELGYSGVCLKKLDTLSERGAALGACLGKLTNCCQYLGGVGENCAIHDIAFPQGGFYVVCKGNGAQPSLDDPILAQSWVWKGQSQGLCLDSIEKAPTVKEPEQKMIIDLFRFLGHQLCQKHGIPQVNTGSQSGITSKVALKNCPTAKEHYLDYKGYCDSKSQLPLAHQAMPYLFYGQTNSDALKGIIAQDTKQFFSSIFNTQEPLKEHKALKQVIAFALSMQRNELLELIRHAATESTNPHHKEEFEAFEVYRNALNKNVIESALIDEGAYIDMLNESGQSALHIAALNVDLKAFEQLMTKSPISTFRMNMAIRYYCGCWKKQSMRIKKSQGAPWSNNSLMQG